MYVDYNFQISENYKQQVINQFKLINNLIKLNQSNN